uniref:Uncharacterized protein n=1 Tax=Serratia plymuthica TaxID=82996 RepID=K7WJ76_SERPL|nr:Hypothetical protein [Serratia plymuthica]
MQGGRTMLLVPAIVFLAAHSLWQSIPDRVNEQRKGYDIIHLKSI